MTETGLIEYQDKQLAQYFQFTPIGMSILGNPGEDECLRAIRALRFVEEGVHWAVGDVAKYLEKNYGSTYTRLAEETGFSEETVRGDAVVADAIETARRRTVLSWSHHREILGLEREDQDFWLDKAESENLSTRELREAISEWKKEKSRPKPVIKSPTLIVGKAEDMHQIADDSVDLIITSPPYNLGSEFWPMGGDGRTPREGIGYGDSLSEAEYQSWQLACLREMYRVAKPGASLFYNHKVRQKGGEMIHPLDWLRDKNNPWTIRQEIIWDRGSTHNHCPSLFWSHDERIYWMTKDKPTLPDRSLDMPTVWSFHGPVAGTWHPAPFPFELPERIVRALGQDGIIVLDPFAGSCTTPKAALKYGYDTIGIDMSEEYLRKAAKENGWSLENVS
jgi:DNA modification methylase